MLPEIDFALVRDILIIAIPMLLVLIFVIKFIVPKKPLLGIGLAVGGGLLGAWLINRRLRSAQDAEETLAAHNKMMAAFKQKQTQRAQLVLSNKKIIDSLEKQREKLARNATKHSDELTLIDLQLEERRKLNQQILSDSSALLDATSKRSNKRRKLLELFESQGSSLTGDAPIEEKLDPTSTIEINGSRLIKV